MNSAGSTSSVDAILLRPLINQARNSPIFLPLGLLHLAAPVCADGYSVEIVDYEFEYRIGRSSIRADQYCSDMCDRLIARSPRVIGITTMADTLPVAIRLGEYIKAHSPHTVVVFGGQGMFGTAPELIRRWPNAVDYLCKGEGDVVFRELVARLRSGESRPAIPGTWSIQDGEIVNHGDASFVNLDDLPPLPYDLLPVAEYLQIASPPIFDVYIGSGCTYKCRFCSTAPFWGNQFRAKSPDTVLAELDQLHERYGVSEFNFLHDNFANRSGWTNQFLRYFIEHNTKYSWGCSVRVDNVTAEQLRQFHQAGCFRIFTGADSGSPKLLREMSKMVNTHRTYEFFRSCRNAGIVFETNTIIGFPGETKDDLELSLAIVFDTVAYGGSAPDISVLQPLPGIQVTQEHRDCLEWVEEMQFGAFLPEDALTLARADDEIFSGFYFIRKANQSFDYYLGLLRLVRYFTRHYFPVVYSLRNLGGYRYLDLLSPMIFDAAPSHYPDIFKLQVAEYRHSHGQHADLIADILTYCDALEFVRGTDFMQEIENVYSAPDARPGAPYRLVRLGHPVHELIASFPEIRAVAPHDTTYLLHLDHDGSVVTLRLSPWQEGLWNELNKCTIEPNDIERTLIQSLVRTPMEHNKVKRAVQSALKRFTWILSESRTLATHRVAPDRQYLGRAFASKADASALPPFQP